MSWADMVTVHDVGRPGVLDGMHALATDAGRYVAALIVVEMSSVVPLPEENIRRIVWRWVKCQLHLGHVIIHNIFLK